MKFALNNRMVRTGLAALLAVAGLASAGNYSSWAHYRQVTVSTSGLNLGAAVTNVPILVRFNATDHADMLNNGATQILPGGADIRVTKADGTTDVPFEIEQATTGASGSLVLWIKADNVAQNSATAATFRVYWGKAGATTLSNSAAVFDTANGWVAVWHMGGGVAVGDTLRDATANGHYAVVSQVDGQGGELADTTFIGTAKAFRATNTGGNTAGFFYAVQNDALKLNLNTDNGPYTLSAWASPKVCASNSRIAVFSKYSNANGNDSARGFGIQTSPSGAWRLSNAPKSLATGSTTNVSADYSADGPCTVDAPTYVSGTYSRIDAPVAGDATGASLWLNDAPSPTALTTGSAQGSSIGDKANVYIGRLHNADRFFRGMMDEVRVSRVALSNDWKRLDYETQRPSGGTAVTIGATQTPSAPPSGYGAWSGHRDITINTAANGAGISGNVTNFPLLVRLGATESAILAAANNGNSIRFSKADDATALPYEIEQWSPTAAAIWVKVDTVYGNNATQKIRMHWGNASAASESNGAAVFDTANGYVGAWHLGNASGANPRPGSVAGSPAAIVRNGLPPVPGIIGMADTLGAIPGINPGNGGNPAAGRYIDFGRDESFAPNDYAGFSDFTTGFSFSTWAYATSTAGFTRFIVLGSDSSATNEVGSTSRIMFMGNQNQSSTQPNFAVRSNGVASYNSPANAYSFNTWTHIFVTKVPGNTAYNIYKNGSLLASSGAGSDPLNVVRNYAWMGRSSASTDGWYGGMFDEVALSKTARSADFVRLSYQNQKAVNAVVDIGAYEYGATVPGNPSNVTAVAGNGQVTVSWAAPTSNGGAAITAYKAMAVSDTNKSCGTTGALTCTVTGLTNGTPYTFIVKASNSVGTGPASLASDTVRPSALAGWTGGRRIVLNTSATGANVAGRVTNFPVLIRLGAAEAAILSAAKSDGSDIRFLKGDSATIIPHQIESWSGTGAAIWVKVDTILGNNATQKIFMIWGNPSASSTSSGSAVFDTAQYLAVWHLGDTGNQTDATGRGNTGNASTPAPAALAASIIGQGKTFDGATTWYQVGADSTALNVNPNTVSFTATAWVNPASCDARIAAFSKYSNSNSIPGRQYALHTGNTTTNWRFTVGASALTGNGDAEFFADADGSCVTGAWAHIAGTWKTSGGVTADSAVNLKIYVNGVQVASGTTAGITGTSLGMQSNTYIGRIATDERYMNGSLDEITFAKVARDTNWIKLAYQNQKAINALVDIGNPPVTVPGAPGTPTASLGGTTGSVVVTWTAPTNTGNATITGYTVTGTPAGSCTTTGALTCTITGLTVGTAHTFVVRAANSAGQGPNSAPSNSVTPVTGILPGAFVIHMDGRANPYSYRIPAEIASVTDEFTMTILDAYGKQVWSKTINPAAKNIREITWNGYNSVGMKVSAGMYVVRIHAVMKGQTFESHGKAVLQH